jgi:hypothetical protein
MLLRYITREILLNTLLVLLALVALFGFFDMVHELDDLGRGTYKLNAMLAFVALTLPSHAYVLLPAAGLIGTLFALARMSESSEITVMRAAGLSLSQLAMFVGAAALVVALVTLLLGEVVSPYTEEAAKGLRLIEVDKADLTDLPDLAERIAPHPFRFVVFCDDLTFDAGEPGYKALKVMLDGSIAGAATNVVIYATSNRRHLLPEYMAENLETRHLGEEVHPGESVEEKISLSERFGLWISFYPFAQDDYLAAVERWLAHFGIKAPASGRDEAERTREALQFALQRGSRSGRVAWQFARHWAGGLGLKRGKS